MSKKVNILDTPIEKMKMVGEAKARLLKSELGISTVRNALYQYPFRYINKTEFSAIKDLRTDGQQAMIRGVVSNIRTVKGKRASRLVVVLRDSSGFIDLVWFKGGNYIQKSIELGSELIAFGKVNVFKGNANIPHPELEKIVPGKELKMGSSFEPVYSSTEKLNTKGMDFRFRKKLIKTILSNVQDADFEENIPDYLKLKLPSHAQAIRWIHFPKSQEEADSATKRLKFEEIFFSQLNMLYAKKKREEDFKGHIFEKVGDKFNNFYHNNLKFELTGAQKKVLREIRQHMGSGKHMNRLIQGDVGSGKTVVAMMSMLLAIDNGFQACLLAPTEILAQQHYESITTALRGLKLQIAFLSGSIKGKKRAQILKFLKSGDFHIVIGTHALLEDPVEFHNLGLAIADEQHRFGVMQRSKLWLKNKIHPPHILVMTATPIPRTLAMTTFGELDISVIDELPPGRKPVRTVHFTDNKRPELLQLMKREIDKGGQVYVVYPLIEESEHFDYIDLNRGYEYLLQFFKPPDYQISVVHGRMKQEEKDYEMRRFVNRTTQIMVATTVIEVGVNVPNASLMVIENANKFGLSQLHQLRGRVGRGMDQAYCVLMTDYKLSEDAKRRIQVMTETNDGFKIAEADLELRGHGQIDGTQQSGTVTHSLVNLVYDHNIVKFARLLVQEILQEDPKLEDKKNQSLKNQIDIDNSDYIELGRIS